MWLSVDTKMEKYPSISPYTYSANNPINIIDPDGKDIIILIDSNAVQGGAFGHAAVLIGNDKDGWRYYSMNGTGPGATVYGKSQNADLGTIKGRNDFRGTGLTHKKVISIIQDSNPNESHNYDKMVYLGSFSKSEDQAAASAAKRQAGKEYYGILGSSCIDVPQEALKAAIEKRIGRKLSFREQNSIGDNILVPNTYYKELDEDKHTFSADGIIIDVNNILKKEGASTIKSQKGSVSKEVSKPKKIEKTEL